MPSVRRAASIAELLAVAVVGGALAAITAAVFIWAVEEGLHALWIELPGRLGVDPFASWWLFAVPIVGGVLVGLGQRVFGDLPPTIMHVVQAFRVGDGVEPRTIPGSFLNAVFALLAGAALGFEAALSGIIGGAATGIGRALESRGLAVRAAWGLAPDAPLPAAVPTSPAWIAALAGVFTYRWLPFGKVDVGFRLAPFDGRLDIGDGLAVMLIAGVVAAPAVYAMRAVTAAEQARWFLRNPLAFGAAGGLALALLATVSPHVLFSGQASLASLDALGDSELAYVAVAKWIAMVVLLLTGWRGGPVFPLWLSAAALGALVAGPLDVPLGLAVVAAMTAVSTAVLGGRLLAGAVLTLYVAPLSYAGTILLAAGVAAVVISVAGPVVGGRPDSATPPGTSDPD